MGESIVQVLVVDDSVPWRRIVASMLQVEPGWRIVFSYTAKMDLYTGFAFALGANAWTVFTRSSG